jgi:error-prone DNA polymerase
MVCSRGVCMNTYAELAVTTNYSFLYGASHPRELVERAAALDLAAIGIADRNTLAGVVRAYAALQEIKGSKPRLLIGARLVFRDGTPDILAYPQDRAAYGRLCRLLSAGKLRAPKGDCYLTFDDVLKWQQGLLLVVMPPHIRGQETTQPRKKTAWNQKQGAEETSLIEASTHVASTQEQVSRILPRLCTAAPSRVWLGISMPLLGDDRRNLHHWKRVAQKNGVPVLATNDVHYHVPERCMLQDVVTCIRECTSLDSAGRLLEMNAERYLKSTEEMQALFKELPETVAETLRFADRISFTLDQIKYNYPDEPVPKGKTPQQHLKDLVEQGLLEKYGHAVPEKVRASIGKELALIAKRDIAQYFLTVHDIVQFARTQKPKILCQGRGSAANSVAMCWA